MSLQVWLPLNGDLHNQGLSDISFNNENSTTIIIDNNGKIGQCYTRSTAVTAGRVISDKNILLDGDLSMCCWAKVIATVGDTANGLITNHSHSDNTGFGITVKQMTDTDYRISCNTGNGSGRTYNTYYGTTNIKNQWHHLALTYKSNIHQFQLWVDGKVELTQSYTNSAKTDKICIFDWSTTYNNSSYHPACSLNDVRIYDHALSQKEIEEIAKGLILWYPLNNIFHENTTNLCSVSTGGWNNSGTCIRIANDTSILYPPTSSNTYSATATSDGSMAVTLGTTPASHPSKTIIASTYVWLDGTQDTSPVYVRSTKTDSSVGSLYYNGSANPMTWPKQQWIRIATNPINTASDATTFYICTYINKNTEVRAFNGWQIEEKNHITPWVMPGTSRIFTTVIDSSGYNNNGTIIGTLEAITPSPRYNYAMKFDGLSYIKKTDFIYNSNIWSVSLWYFKPNNPTNYESLFCLSKANGGDSNKKIAACPNSGRIWYKGESGSGSISQLKINEWANLIITCNGTTVTIYQNANQIGTFAASTALTGCTDLVIGARANIEDVITATIFYTGNMSDFRIYATALTEAQIQELYKTSMLVSGDAIIPHNLA